MGKKRDWLIPVHYTYSGYIVVSAKDEITAQEQIGSIDMEPGAELIDWECHGKVEEFT